METLQMLQISHLISTKISDEDVKFEIDEKAALFVDKYEDVLNRAQVNLDNPKLEIAEYIRANGEIKSMKTKLHRVFSEAFDQVDEIIKGCPASVEKTQVAIANWFAFHPSFAVGAYFQLNSELAVKLGLSLDPQELHKLSVDADYTNEPAYWFTKVRLLEVLDYQQFEDEISEGKEWFRKFLQERADKSEGLDPEYSPLPAQYDMLWGLLYAARYSSLVAATFSPARRLSENLISFQNAAGWWTDLAREPDPSVFQTVCISYALAVFGNTQTGDVKTSMRKAMRWIRREQQIDGGWKIRQSNTDSDAVTTAITIELMQRLDLDEYEQSIRHGREFLLSKQDQIGYWDSKGPDPEHFVILILESLGAALSPIPQHESFIVLSRELLFKSEELLRTGDHVDTQLAIMAAHQSVEMCFYGIFLRLDPAEGFFRHDGKTTIGLRESMSLMLTRLHQDGVLPKNAGLPFSSQLKLMANARDGIVHQGQSIPHESAKEHVKFSRKFLEKISRLSGINILLA